MAVHNDLGKQGEMAIVDFFVKRGFVILETNWRYRRNEIDIIVENDDTIVFAEVKTRSSMAWGTPESFLSESQISRLVEAANYYIEINDISKDIRFDVFAVVKYKDELKWKHFPDFLTP